MRKDLVFVALAAVSLLAACEDSDGPFGPGDEVALSGTYAASPVESGEIGAIGFEIESGGELRDMIAEGASIVLGLHANGATSGHLFIPAEDEGDDDVDADLTGTWTVEAGRVHLDHDADTFLRDLSFEIEDGGIIADEDVDGARVRIELERVIPQGGDDPVPGPEGFEVTGDLAIMESFPVQLIGFMTFTNVSDETRELVTDVCWPLLRAYEPGEDEPVWDQAEEGACNLFTPREDVVEPGESVRFQSPVVSGADILDDDLPDGDYRITVYFNTAGEDEIELDLGEIDLAIPR